MYVKFIIYSALNLFDNKYLCHNIRNRIFQVLMFLDKNINYSDGDSMLFFKDLKFIIDDTLQ